MKLTLGARALSTETLTYAAQLGVGHLKVNGNLFMDGLLGPADRDKVLRALELVRSHGLEIAVVLIPQNPGGILERIKRGAEGRDRDIDDICASLEVYGGAGIRVAEYVFNLSAYSPGSVELASGRGGAVTRNFDFRRIQQEQGEEAPPRADTAARAERMWENLEYFLKAVVPAAEAAGMRLACHPDDPPMGPIGEDPRILSSVEALERLLALHPSAANGLCFCQGTVAEMGADIPAVIRSFGGRDRINHVHFRNVRGAVPAFSEVVIDVGDTDKLEAMRAFKDVGYTRTLMPDHAPLMIPDPGSFEGGGPWPSAMEHRGPFDDPGRAYAFGYIRALMTAVGY